MLANVSAELDRLQFGHSERRLFIKPVPIGLGGQVTGRKDALRLALALGRQAVFADLCDFPYGQTFRPLGPPADADAIPALARLDIFGEDGAGAVLFDAGKDAVRGPPEIENRLLALVETRLGLKGLTGPLLDGAILAWMKPQASVAAYVEEQRQRLQIDDSTLGVHFRRGDKQVETAFVPASEFNRRIAAMHRAWPFRAVFLASDSPDAPSEIVLPHGVRLIFDTEEQRYNNANHKMLMSSPELVEQETRSAYKNIALLSACGGLIGQDNAHFATLAGSTILVRHGAPERVSLIDGRIAEKTSPWLRIRFRLQNSVRAAGRRLLPWMTASARMKRLAARNYDFS
ncbi:MAG: hypothetical protein EON59_03085 [Alphaproteobacteria bacterium]|nr:MAG: hypothetical protein EON59_03085 [Alphaproteobacteria bacterium]